MWWPALRPHDEFPLADYSMHDLMFAKFDTTELVESTDNLFTENGPLRLEINQYIPVSDWSRVSADFSGIHVDPDQDANNDIFVGWDVDTVVIWNVKFSPAYVSSATRAPHGLTRSSAS